MEELLIVIVQFVVEVLAQSIINIPFDLATPSRDSSGARTLRYIAFLVVGGVVGGLSVVVVPHTMLQYSALRVLNLILAPLIAGYLARRIAQHRAKANLLIEPTIHYWSAFWFTLAFAAIRLAYAKHGGA